MRVTIILITAAVVAGLSGVSNKPSKIYALEMSPKSQKNDSAKNEKGDNDKEKELRKALAEIRDAIKEYKYACEEGLVGPLDRKKDDQCYPPTLETLVDGIRPPNKKHYLRFLQRIPIDPITGKSDWVIRSAQDEKGAENWGGQNVFNVFSRSDGYASDWTKYREW